jgi:hypothetical protein
MIPDSTLAIRFPVPTTIWCELADGVSGLVGQQSCAQDCEPNAVALSCSHDGVYSPTFFFALQTQKIPERAAGALVWLCGLSRRISGIIGLVEPAPRCRSEYIDWGSDGHCLEK